MKKRDTRTYEQGLREGKRIGGDALKRMKFIVAKLTFDGKTMRQSEIDKGWDLANEIEEKFNALFYESSRVT